MSGRDPIPGLLSTPGILQVPGMRGAPKAAPGSAAPTAPPPPPARILLTPVAAMRMVARTLVEHRSLRALMPPLRQELLRHVLSAQKAGRLLESLTPYVSDTEKPTLHGKLLQGAILELLHPL